MWVVRRAPASARSRHTRSERLEHGSAACPRGGPGDGAASTRTGRLGGRRKRRARERESAFPVERAERILSIPLFCPLLGLSALPSESEPLTCGLGGHGGASRQDSVECAFQGGRTGLPWSRQDAHDRPLEGTP